MKPTDIKWAFTHEPTAGISPTELFEKCALLFTGEVIRSDELAIISCRSQPVALCRNYKIDFETRDNYVESIEAPGFDWQFVFDLLRAKQGLIVSGFEILCYRGKNAEKAITPQQSFKNYTDAKRHASRVIYTMFALHTSAELNLCTVAQVTEKVSDKYFKELRKNPGAQTHTPMDESHLQIFLQAVDAWQLRYTDAMGAGMYKKNKRFPLVPLPVGTVTQHQDFR